MTKRPENNYAAYHAHVYFSEVSVDRAEKLCLAAGECFQITVGRIHRRLVGPHPHWSCQLAFGTAQFEILIEWLEANRDGLNILVHGLTGDDLADHTEHAAWLGASTPLKLDMFREKVSPDTRVAD